MFFPAPVNSIPSRVRIEIDVRDIDEARRDRVSERSPKIALKLQPAAALTSEPNH